MGITIERTPSGSPSHAPNVTYQHRPVPQLHPTSTSCTDHVDQPCSYSPLPYYPPHFKGNLAHEWMNPSSFSYLTTLEPSSLSNIPLSQCAAMDPLSPVDLDEATSILRPFELQGNTVSTANGLSGLSLDSPSLQAPFDTISVSAIPSNFPSLLYNPTTQPLWPPTDKSSNTFATLCPWSHSTSPTPSLSPSPFHLTSSTSQSVPTLSTASSSASHTSSRPHSPFSTIEDDTQSRLWSAWTPVRTHETKSSSSMCSLSPISKSQSSPSSSLTCSVCHKKYANNSTLRRHQKIHVYAKNARTPSASRPPPQVPTLSMSSMIPFAKPSATSSSTSTAPLLGGLVLSAGHAGATTAERHTIPGYSPGFDPDIKKPECVGCGKAFARRDTVILHIKNQKRHWDEFVVMREQWLQEKKASEVTSGLLSNTHVSLGVASFPMVTSGTREAKKGAQGRRRGPRPRKAADRYRRAEKLWHSMQHGRIRRRQLQKSSLTGSSLRTRYRPKPCKGMEEIDAIFEFELDDVDAASVEDEWEEEEEDGDEEGEVIKEGAGDAEMYDAALVTNMDARQKFEWIMRTMRMPRCWKERKVRLFGAFGVLEESVLQ